MTSMNTLEKPKSLYRTSSTAICVACQILFSQGIAAASYTGSDSFDRSEQTMLSRFPREKDHPTAECKTVNPDTLHPYKTYTFKTDDSGQLTASFDPADDCNDHLYVSFHQGRFDPANLCANFIWTHQFDEKFTGETFTVPPSSEMTMVVNRTIPSPLVSCKPFTWTLEGANAPAATGLWVSKLSIKDNEGSEDSWQATFIYNADRSAGDIFNPQTQNFKVAVGGSNISIAAGKLIGDAKGFSYKSPKNETPVVSIKGNPSKQTLNIKVSKTDVGNMGSGITTSVRLGEVLNQFTAPLTSGKYKSVANPLSDSFVVVSGKLRNKEGENGTLKASFKLASPSLISTLESCNGDCKAVVKLKLYRNAETAPFVDEDLTDLLSVSEKTQKDNKSYSINKNPAKNKLTAFRYTSSNGSLSLGLDKLALPFALIEEKLGVELTIGENTYKTFVTLFAKDDKFSSYSTAF